VYRYALYRLKGDKQAAEDVVQEVFLRAVECIGAFQGDVSGLSGWLRGIGRRVIARRLRAWEARTPPSPTCAEYPASTSTADLPEARLLHDEESLRVGAALTSLPRDFEQALRWKYCDGLRVEEFARKLDFSFKAAESLLNRARVAFRKMYRRFVQADGQVHDVEDWLDE
jgi:RNA polymerase sigma-70 factor (ECF subfamily)